MTEDISSFRSLKFTFLSENLLSTVLYTREPNPMFQQQPVREVVDPYIMHIQVFIVLGALEIFDA
jgi:hypothetical protein